MTRHESMTPSEIDALNAAQVVFTANPLFIAPQAKHFWQVQERILDEAEKFSSGWFQRRHEATRSMIDAHRRLLSKGHADPANAMTEIIDWQTHSMQRLAEDANACTELMTICAGALVNNEIEAVEETTKADKPSAKPSKSSPV